MGVNELMSVAVNWLSTREAALLLCGVTDRTVRNCITLGNRTPIGVIRLRAVVLGGRYFTRREWVAEFLAAVTRARMSDTSAPAMTVPEPRGERDRRFASEQARLKERLAGRSHKPRG
jgi:hypothetical protein